MLVLPVVDGPTERFALLPDEYVTRDAKRGDALPAGLGDTAAIELTSPMVTPITEGLTAGDPELAAFWKAESATHRYNYVTFRVTFGPPANASFQRGWVEIGLGDGGAIAWSMFPDQVTDTSKLTDTGTLGVDFKFLKADTGGNEEVEVQTPFLRAWREHTAQPYWAFQETRARAMEGTFRLHLVVRSPLQLAGAGTVKVRAVLERQTFWIFRRTGDAQPASMVFQIAAA